MKKDYRDYDKDDAATDSVNHQVDERKKVTPDAKRLNQKTNSLGLYGFTEEDWNQPFFARLNIREFLGLFFLSALGVCFYEALALLELFPETTAGVMALDFGVFFVFGYFCFMISRLAIRKRKQYSSRLSSSKMKPEQFSLDGIQNQTPMKKGWMQDQMSSLKHMNFSDLDSLQQWMDEAQMTSAHYSMRGEVREEMQPDGGRKIVHMEHLPEGQVKVQIHLQDAAGNNTNEISAKVLEHELEAFLQSH